jgi:hypothetical protein
VEQLLAHLVGDYVLQNHWMANRKTTSWLAAIIHAVFYGIPFLLLVSTWWQWAIIVGTHAVIDHYRLAKYWVEFWGIGQPGWVGQKLGLDVKTAPDFLAVWLLIIVDNTMHLAINYFALSLA